MAFSFGAPTPSTSNANTGFSFGGNSAKKSVSFATPTVNTNQAAPSSTTGFSFSGGNSANTASTGNCGFSFGGASTTPVTPKATSGFSFGNSNTTSVASTPASTGFGFGTASAIPAPTGGFGLSSMSAAASTPGTGFGFGTATTTSGAATNTGFSFNSTPATSGTSFLNTANNNGFGTSSSSFGTGSLASTGGAINPLNTSQTGITLDTAFTSLPDPLKKTIQEFGEHIKKQEQEYSSIKSVSSKKLHDLQRNTDALKQNVVVLKNKQDNQRIAIKNLKLDVKHIVRGAENAGHSVHCMKTGSKVQREIQMPSQYFWDLLQMFENRMQSACSQIEQIESQLGLKSSEISSEDSNYGTMGQHKVALLQRTIQSQNEVFLRVAGQVAETHEMIDQLREQYMKTLQLEYDQHGGSGPVRNPFEAADRFEAEERKRAIEKLKGTQQNSSSAPTATHSGTNIPQSSISGSSLFGSSTFGSTKPTTPASQTPSLFGTTVTPSSSFVAAPSHYPSTPGTGLFGSTSFATPAPSTNAGSSITPSTALPSFGAAAAAGPGDSLFSTSAASSSFSTTSKNKSRRQKTRKR